MFNDRLGWWTLLPALVVALLAAASGCHRGEVLAEVTGLVTLAGKPLTQGYVIFRNEAKGVHMTAEIGPDGRYRASTAGGFGLPLGEYRVAISPPIPDIPFGPAKSPPKPGDILPLPEKYTRPETSGLAFQLTDEGTTIDVEMAWLRP